MRFTGLDPQDHPDKDFVPALGDDGRVHLMAADGGLVEPFVARRFLRPFRTSSANVYGSALCGEPVTRPYVRFGYQLEAGSVVPEFLTKPLCEACEALRDRARAEANQQ